MDQASVDPGSSIPIHRRKPESEDIVPTPSLFPDLDELILESYPYPIAIAYRHLLHTTNDAARQNWIYTVLDYVLKTLGVVAISQYLVRGAMDQAKNDAVSKLIHDQVQEPSLSTWKDAIYGVLKAYKPYRRLFFMPELCALRWDARTIPSFQITLEEIIKERNGLSHAGGMPTSEEAWHRHVELSLERLYPILKAVRFLADYNMVLIKGQGEGTYTCALYRGTEVRDDLVIAAEANRQLEPGWFYLLRIDGEALALDPWLVFWQGIDRQDTDTGVYCSLKPSHVDYVTAQHQRAFPDSKRVTRLSDLVYRSQKIGASAQRSLSWSDVGGAAEEITDERGDQACSRYAAGLYLPRVAAIKIYKNFLRDDARALLILGRSGVGKSSFLASLRGGVSDEASADAGTCMALYDARELSTEQPLLQTLTADFNRLMGPLSGRQPPDNILATISSEIRFVHCCRLVLAIDAVNEHEAAPALARRINELLNTLGTDFPWFKVILTARPESWRAMTAGVPLKERFFYRTNDRPGTPVGIELAPFEDQELAAVYNRYKTEYRLETAYEQLSAQTRVLLRDPLTLKLVAKTHRSGSIPATLQAGQTVKDYVVSLVEDARLDKLDEDFLLNALLPQMVSEERVQQALTAEQIERAYIEDRKTRLRTLIISNALDDNGRPYNRSFVNLVDAEILTLSGLAAGYEVGFRYERFYDYFAGRRIYGLSMDTGRQPAFWRKWIGRIAQAPYLWGAIKTGLLVDAQEPHPQPNAPTDQASIDKVDLQILSALCYGDEKQPGEQRVREMVIDVLVDLGRDYPQPVAGLLDKILTPPNRSALQAVLRKTPAIEPEARNAQKIAVEVAGQLGLTDALTQAVLLPDPSIRAAAVRGTYHLWSHDADAGLQVLQHTGRSVPSGLLSNLTNRTPLDSALMLSLAVFFDHAQDQATAASLGAVWHEIIGKLFHINDKAGTVQRTVSSVWRRGLYGLASTVIFGLLDGFPDYAKYVNYDNLARFFKTGKAERELYRRLTSYMDAHGQYPLDQMRQDYLAALETDSLLMIGVVVLSMIVQLARDRDGFLPVIREFVAAAEAAPQPNYWVATVPVVLMSLLDDMPQDDEVFALFVQIATLCQTYYRTHPEIPGIDPITVPQGFYLGPYIFYTYARNEPVASEWLTSRVNAALEKNDLDFFRVLTRSELSIVGIERRRPAAATQALALFFKRCSPEVRTMIGDYLARLRTYEPDAVDAFLEEQDADVAFRVSVRTNEPSESPGALIGTKSWQFIKKTLVHGDAFSATIIKMLMRAADERTLKAWINYAIRSLLNMVYGAQVLPLAGQDEEGQQ